MKQKVGICPKCGSSDLLYGESGVEDKNKYKYILQVYPSAHCRQYDKEHGKKFVILRDYSPFYITISHASKTEEKAWESAYKILHKERSRL